MRKGRKELVLESIGRICGGSGGSLAIEERLTLAIGRLSLTDIAKGSDRSCHVTAMVADGRAHGINRAFRPVGPYQDVLSDIAAVLERECGVFF